MGAIEAPCAPYDLYGMTLGNAQQVGRRALAAVAVGTLLTAMFAPAAQAASQRSALDKTEELVPGLSQGKASTRIALARIHVSTVADRGEIPAALGELVAAVDTTIRKPLSALQLTGVRADDKTAVEWERDNLSADAVGYK